MIARLGPLVLGATGLVGSTCPGPTPSELATTSTLTTTHSVWNHSILRPAGREDAELSGAILAVVRYPAGQDLEIEGGEALLPVDRTCDVFDCSAAYPAGVQVEQEYVLGRGIFLCTAAFLSEDRVLTAAHCISHVEPALCRTYFVMQHAQAPSPWRIDAQARRMHVPLSHLLRPTSVEVRTEAEHRGPDWAIVRVAPVGDRSAIAAHPTLPELATAPPAPGTPIEIPSHLGGLSLMIATGRTAVRPPKRGAPGMLWARFDSAGGASGAPVLDADRAHTLAVVRGNDAPLHHGVKLVERPCHPYDTNPRCFELLTPASLVEPHATHPPPSKEPLQCPSPTP